MFRRAKNEGNKSNFGGEKTQEIKTLIWGNRGTKQFILGEQGKR